MRKCESVRASSQERMRLRIAVGNANLQPIRRFAWTTNHTLPETFQARGFRSRILRNRRDVLVYLPRRLPALAERRYPVLYLHDGQNVFDAATAFGGVEWGVDETAQRLDRDRV